jgi:chromosome segregation ATPase
MIQNRLRNLFYGESMNQISAAQALANETKQTKFLKYSLGTLRQKLQQKERRRADLGLRLQALDQRIEQYRSRIAELDRSELNK